MKLTDEQQAIVEHTWDPALVFAVAGSGKTTAMVHRVQRLITKRTVAPDKILATSFSNAAVKDIIEQLSVLGVPASVHCRTLHGLGYQIIRLAARFGHIERDWLSQNDPEGANRRILNKTFVQLSIAEGADIRDLQIDREDFNNQVSIWKGSLAYAEPGRSQLPESAAEVARQAKHENQYYIQAYKIYEKLRRAAHILTFDDMLMTAWEILMCFPDILDYVQSLYDMVMVDEFQDVNYAQYRMMDLIAGRHNNYMVIGDDDQCIYDWRGADPSFILNFEKKYQATVYKISDNFRCPARQVAFANAVIHHNKQRYPKRLNLTRGFRGGAQIISLKDDMAVARHIAGEIYDLLEEGRATIDDIAILIRIYSQTASLESVFIEMGLPYIIDGSPPFYKRRELVTLFQYLSFAMYELAIRNRTMPDDEQAYQKYYTVFETIINQPRRYISRDFVQFFMQESRRKSTSLMHIMTIQKDQLKERPRKNLEKFMKIIQKLIGRLHKPAHKVLRWLVEEIEYNDHLMALSGIYEIGVTRIQTVEALIQFAKNHGRCNEFLDEIRKLSMQPTTLDGSRPPIKIMTIYKSKGLEWPYVFLPGCDEGLMPLAIAGAEAKDRELVRDVESERRLFYVALTRSKKNVFMYHNRQKGLSPFLKEINPGEILGDLQKITTMLANEKTFVFQKDLMALSRLISKYHLQRYFSEWAVDDDEFLADTAHIIEDIYQKSEQARTVVQQYQAAHQRYEAQEKDRDAAFKTIEKEIHERQVVIRKFKSAYHPVSRGEILQFDKNSENDVMVMSQHGIVGIVAFEKMPEFDQEWIFWAASTVRIEEITDSGTWLDTRFQRFTPNSDYILGQIKSIEAPPEPSQKLMDFGDEALFQGINALMAALQRREIIKQKKG